MISENRLQEALTYLATTDESCANARAYYEGLKDQSKTYYSAEYLKSTGKNVEERKAKALTSEAVKTHQREIREAHADYEIMRNKRATQVLIIEVWRSLNSARKKGNIV